MPGGLNPGILSEEAAQLADENRKIEAVASHCSTTGCGLADSKRIVEDYIQKRKQ